MVEMKINKNDYFVSEMVFSVESWEKFKKLGDKELYKKINKYEDYEELRVYFNDKSIELEAHCVKEDDEDNLELNEETKKELIKRVKEAEDGKVYTTEQMLKKLKKLEKKK